MLFAGTSLDKARSVFADYAKHRPAAQLTIRQRSRALARDMDLSEPVSKSARDGGPQEGRLHCPGQSYDLVERRPAHPINSEGMP